MSARRHLAQVQLAADDRADQVEALLTVATELATQHGFAGELREIALVGNL